MATAPMHFDTDGLSALYDLVVQLGYQVYGPQVQNGVITIDELGSIDDLPIGWGDVQAPGSYRLRRRADEARFGYAVGPSSWKALLHPPREQVWRMDRMTDGELSIQLVQPEACPRVFFGVRPCEMEAILRQDTVLAEGPHPDPSFAVHRTNSFLVVVDCGAPAETCFCPSTGSGPTAGSGFDIALTELVTDSTVSYVARSGSDRGHEVLAAVPNVRAATASEIASAERAGATAEARITRRLDSNSARETLFDSLESPIWDDIAERCLTCANCTMVCPTCFCTDLVDTTDLAGDHTERWRHWDSCFSLEYSHLGPGPHRESGASRYRQWLTHKLGSWIDQFGESGCVGCGRCITWCPVGIDLTAELPKFAAATKS